MHQTQWYICYTCIALLSPHASKEPAQPLSLLMLNAHQHLQCTGNATSKPLNAIFQPCHVRVRHLLILRMQDFIVIKIIFENMRIDLRLLGWIGNMLW